MATRGSSRIHKRTVVVLGKTGAGKSTVANKLLETDTGEPSFEISHEVIESYTHKTASSTSILKTDDAEYLVEAVDTVGFFDTTGVKNEEVIAEIKQFCRERIPDGVNLIIFVYKQGRWTDEEQKTFDFITQNFTGDVSDISALVITGCDGFTDEMKSGVVSEFQRAQKRIADFMKKGIYAVSFPDLTKLKAEIKQAHTEYQKDDQEMLRTLVYSCAESKLAKDILLDSFWDKLRACTIL